MILSVFAGSGKTFLEEHFPETVKDLESSDFRWVYGYQASRDREARKGDATDRVENPNFVDDYIEAILKANTKYDFVFISCHENVLDKLTELGQQYTMVVPNVGMRQVYVDRYTARGNSEEFISSIKQNFHGFRSDMINRALHNDNVSLLHITESKPFLSDVLGMSIDSELVNNFTYHPPTDEKKVKFENIRRLGLSLAAYIAKECPKGREISVAQTKIEEAIMWANASVARNKETE